MNRKIWLVLAELNLAISAAFAMKGDQILATHFDGFGHANGFMRANTYSTFTFVFAAFINLVLWFVGRTFRTEAGLAWANIPHRSYWMATAERRQEVLGSLREVMTWTGVFVNGVLLGAHALIYGVNFYGDAIGVYLVMTYLGLVFTAAAWMILRIFRLFAIPA